MKRLALGLGALALALAGCKASDAGPQGGASGGSSNPGSGGNRSGSGGNGSGSGGNGSPGSGGNGSGGNGSGGSGSGGSTVITLSCASASLGRPVLRLMTRTELQNTLGDVFPEVKSQWSASLPASNISDFGFDNDSSASVGTQLASSVLDAATSVATAVTGSVLSTLLPCSTGAADHACAETFLNKYGQKLFRRPVTSAEHDKYLAFFDASKTKSDFKTALKYMTIALIQSPNALYRSEVGADAGNSTRKLTPYETVTELAYNYTGTTPTDAMLSMAASGNLGDLTALAKSLIATDQGKQMLQHFFEQYFDFANVPSMSKPNIATFSQVSDDMVQESHAFIDSIVFQNGGGMKELLTAKTTNPSKSLATYYATGNAYTGGFPSPSSDYASVTRPAGTGIGILAQGAFLAAHASPTNDSPTKRGLLPYRKFFCKPKISPPPNVPQLDVTTPMANVNTTRDHYEMVHELNMGPTGSCAGCHKLFDPIGFGFEHFDEGGRYRTKEGTYDVNSAATAQAADGSSMTFTDEESLMSDLVSQPIIHECMAAYLATYSFGTNDACIGAGQVSALQSGSIGIAEAFARLVTEPHFTQRASQ
ncbi:MAG TPA: DUF1588 domain-containing protein [Polyangia bacterium]